MWSKGRELMQEWETLLNKTLRAFKVEVCEFKLQGKQISCSWLFQIIHLLFEFTFAKSVHVAVSRLKSQPKKFCRKNTQRPWNLSLGFWRSFLLRFNDENPLQQFSEERWRRFEGKQLLKWVCGILCRQERTQRLLWEMQNFLNTVENQKVCPQSFFSYQKENKQIQRADRCREINSWNQSPLPDTSNIKIFSGFRVHFYGNFHRSLSTRSIFKSTHGNRFVTDSPNDNSRFIAARGAIFFAILYPICSTIILVLSIEI